MFKKFFQWIRIVELFLLVLVIFSSLKVLGVNPWEFSRYVGARFTAAVGISSTASVPPNPFNTLALQLKQKEEELARREQLVEAKAAAIESPEYILRNRVIWVLIILVFSLIVLVLFNFYLDFRRRRQEEILEEEIKELIQHRK